MTNRATSSTAHSANDADRIARAALTLLAEPGHRVLWSIAQQDGAPATLERLLTGDIPDASLRATAAARAARGDVRRLAQAALRRAQRLNARLVVPGDSEWPAQVDDLTRLGPSAAGPITQRTAPPLGLWVRGERSLSEAFTRSVAIVGARAATSYGAHISNSFAYVLADQGWSIISGGAYGIDAAAHRGALAAGGLTVAVLAGGIDRPHPAGNAALFHQIIADGLLVSEWPPGAEPLQHRFTIRNRLIAAAGGTVVVEATTRSGAVQTIRQALNLGRPAMVVPGPVTSATSTGCHSILRDNPAARLVTSPDEIVTELSPADH